MKSFQSIRTNARVLVAAAACLALLSACDSSSQIRLRGDSGTSADLFKPAGGAEFVSGALTLEQTGRGFYVEATAGSYISKNIVTTPRGYKVYHGVQTKDQ